MSVVEDKVTELVNAIQDTNDISVIRKQRISCMRIRN